MKKTEIGVYKITIENHIYIGSTSINFLRRKSKHLSDLSRGKHINPMLQHLYNKYNYIKFEVLEVVENKVDVIKREQYYIDLLNPDINICKIAGSSLGRIVTQETKDKISKTLIEVNKKISKSIMQYNLEGTFIREWNSACEIKRILGLSRSYIKYCCKNSVKTSHGFVWKYKNN